jgi:hypothetical protein
VEFADAEPGLTQTGDDRHGPVYAYRGADAVEVSLWWRDGLITLPSAMVPQPAGIAAIAARFGARLVGDGREEYRADGTVVHWTEPRPPPPHRPLQVGEAAEAWEVLLDREVGREWRPVPGHARHARTAFRRFAVRDVVIPGRAGPMLCATDTAPSPGFRAGLRAPVDGRGTGAGGLLAGVRRLCGAVRSRRPRGVVVPRRARPRGMVRGDRRRPGVGGSTV